MYHPQAIHSTQLYWLTWRNVSKLVHDALGKPSVDDILSHLDSWLDCWLGCADVLVRGGGKVSRFQTYSSMVISDTA